MDNPFRDTNLKLLPNSTPKRMPDDSMGTRVSGNKSEPEPFSSPESEKQAEYCALVGGIIERARLACGQPPLDPAVEYIPACLAWSEILMGVVPVHRLDDCYLMAMRSRKSSAPLNASELCEAWRQLCESERYTPKPNPSAGCSVCNGTGFEYLPTQRASRPCECRKKGA